MKKIIAFGASTSSKSINQKLAAYAASQIKDIETEVLKLSDFECPIYSSDREENDGFPAPAENFVKKIKESDGLIISFAEHNGAYSAAFKNTLDWASRVDSKVWADKKMLLMSSSPGKRGGATALQAAVTSFPHFGAKIAASFSLPSFYDNFSEDGIKDSELKSGFDQAVSQFLS